MFSLKKVAFAAALIAAPLALASCHSTPYGACVHLDNGQTTINENPAGTVYCLSGTHNWSLTPKTGDVIYGDSGAVLDGGGSTLYAINAGSADNVTLDNFEIRNYRPGDQEGAIRVTDSSAPTNWKLKNLNVHHNGASGNGDGSEAGNGWQFIGGNYHNNRAAGISGQIGDNVVIDGVEIAWNNFTSDAHTTRSHSCGDEAGGFKWVADNITVKNSSIHDNACKGLWSDLEADGMIITNNEVYNNWDEGIFIELSTNATITGNTVYGNGFKNYNGDGSGCPWVFGGGITLSTSGITHINPTGTILVSGNTVYDNCNSITGPDQFRDEHSCESAPRCSLGNIRIQNNTVTGSTRSSAENLFGMASDEGDNLTDNNIVFGTNSLSGVDNCGLNC